MRAMTVIPVLVVVCVGGVAAQKNAWPGPHVWGIECPVPDPPAAAAWFTKTLGMTVDPRGGDGVTVRLDRARIVFVPRGKGTAPPADPSVYMNFRVGDLAGTAARLAEAGAVVDDPRKIVIGEAFRFRDPFGFSYNVIKLQGTPDDAPLGTFNVSVNGPGLVEREKFFHALGFTTYSRDWLPATLPLNRSGGVALVLHEGEGQEQKGAPRVLLAVADFEAAAGAVGGKLTDPVGNRLGLHAVSGPALAFEKLKLKKGSWQAVSTKGWKGRTTYEVIANDSVVVEREQVAPHPDQTMVTMFHMDGDRLMLTHYCVAKNQPRLVATGFEAQATRVDFRFRDGTNIPTRDEGHMDRAVFRFLSENEYTSRWTWYQDGKEAWMEEVRYRRKK